MLRSFLLTCFQLFLVFGGLLQAQDEEFNLSDYSEIVSLGKVRQTEYYLHNIRFDVGTSNYMGVVLLRTANDQPDVGFDVDESGQLVDGSGNVIKIPSVEQVLYHGINCAQISQEGVQVMGKGFQLIFIPGTGRYQTPSQVTDIWKWNGEAFSLELHKEVKPYEEMQKKYHALLKAGDFIAARKLPLEDSPNGGWTCLGDEYNEAYLKASCAHAKRQYSQGAKFDAGLTAIQALFFPPYYYCDQAEASDFISWTKRGKVPTGEDGAAPICNRLKHTDANVRLLNDLAWYLCEAGFPIESIPFFEQVIALRPERVVAHLNLADALWDSGATYDSSKHYQRYLDLHAKHLPGKTPVKRALDRTK